MALPPTPRLVVALLERSALPVAWCGFLAGLFALLLGCDVPVPPTPGPQVRVASFNVKELSVAEIDDCDESGAGRHPQLLAAAAIIKKMHPDILVLNEIDFDTDDPTGPARRFVDHYLARGERPIDYPHIFSAPTNTGLLSGFDLDNDGVVAGPELLGSREYGGDSWGFGTYPGQYGMALLSRYPIAASDVRTFQHFRWADLPGNHLPEEFYSAEERESLRLSSKSHWDVPVQVDVTRLHLWLSHPTPPSFDGDEDRNGRRNFDEIRFWKLYLDGEPTLYDDDGRHGGYAAAAPFLVAGDLNARPETDVSLYDGRTAISQLLEDQRIQDTADVVRSPDGSSATAGFLGGSRVDYLLPSTDVEVLGGGLFWPDEETDPADRALAEAASDHRFVWLDLRLPGPDS